MSNNRSSVRNELREACSRLQSELGIYSDHMKELTKLFSDCFMSAPILDPEKSDYIEHCFHTMLGYANNANALFEEITAYANRYLKDADIMELGSCEAQTQRLQETLSAKFPSVNDILRMKNMFMDCQMIIDDVSHHKWQGGKSSANIDAVFTLREQYAQLSGLTYQVKCLLEEYKVEKKRDIFMGAVYASPEVMMGTGPRFSEIDDSRKYPYMHSFSGTFSNDEEEPIMEVIYGSPEMILEHQNNTDRRSEKGHVQFCMYCGNMLSNPDAACFSCGKVSIEADPEETVWFCSKCGGTIPMIARYCSFCGNNLRKDTVSETPETSMACVYASPKKSLLARLFKGKK